MATMINNVTEFGKRTKIIIDILKVLVKEHIIKYLKKVNEEFIEFRTKNKYIIPDLSNIVLEYLENDDNEDLECTKNKRQILILSNRRNHLQIMKEFIDNNNIATTGYYVGGMKAKDLKKSEEAQIIFGTFSMADTGLDIKTLNTLILASPKSNIEQSVGRIMRKKHDFVLKIIDIVDNFSVFINQSKKRLTLYKREMNRYRKEYGEESFKIMTNMVDEDGFVKDMYYTEPTAKALRGSKKKDSFDPKTAGCLFNLC